MVLPLQAISIVGDEVFSFSMSLTPKATEGAGYADTSKTDGNVQLNVGCVQVVYLHKFVMSLLVSLNVGTGEISDNGLEYLKPFFVFKYADTLFLQFLFFFSPRNPG